MKYFPPLWFVSLALAYVAVALINREFGWSWGREWAAPTLMLCVFAATLFLACQGSCRRTATPR